MYMYVYVHVHVYHYSHTSLSSLSFLSLPLPLSLLTVSCQDVDSSQPAQPVEWPEECLSHFKQLVPVDSEVELLFVKQCGGGERERGEGREGEVCDVCDVWRVRLVMSEGGETSESEETGSEKMDVRTALIARLRESNKQSISDAAPAEGVAEGEEGRGEGEGGNGERGGEEGKREGEGEEGMGEGEEEKERREGEGGGGRGEVEGGGESLSSCKEENGQSSTETGLQLDELVSTGSQAEVLVTTETANPDTTTTNSGESDQSVATPTQPATPEEQELDVAAKTATDSAKPVVDDSSTDNSAVQGHED